MNKIVIHSIKQRPLRFNGELLASNHRNAELITALEAKDYIAEEYKGGYHPDYVLNLFRTSSGKVIEQHMRFKALYTDENDESTAYPDLYQNRYVIYDSIEDYFEAKYGNGSEVGYVTKSLVDNLVESNPEFLDLWVKDID